MTTPQPDRLDRIEALVERNSVAIEKNSVAIEKLTKDIDLQRGVIKSESSC